MTKDAKDDTPRSRDAVRSRDEGEASDPRAYHADAALGADAHTHPGPQTPSSVMAQNMPSSLASRALSPQPLRTTSPARSPRSESNSVSTRTSGRTLACNNHDPSPVRPPTTSAPGIGVPSAAAIQRALSATSLKQGIEAPEEKKTIPPAPKTVGAAPDGDTVTHWPVSRLKSPPPPPPPGVTTPRRSSSQSRKAEPLSSMSPYPIQHPTPLTPIHSPSKPDVPGADANDQAPAPKGAGRGAGGPSKLETVQEGSAPAESVSDTETIQSSFTSLTSNTLPDDARSRTSPSRGPLEQVGSRKAGSESESGENRSDRKAEQMSKQTPQQQQQPPPSVTKKHPTRIMSKARNGSESRKMTVETETVATIPQASITADRSVDTRLITSGSLRLKPSTETIRPKKERRKVTRKAPSVPGTASSKADIFEAKVANAVDEANSSDSDETFVYESNPPEPHLRPGRHHSRTPSTTSAHSAADYRGGMRSGSLLDRAVHGKRSMKFCKNLYNSGPDGETSERTEGGALRQGSLRLGSGGAHHLHIGHFGRRAGQQQSLLDNESPLPPGSKLRSSVTGVNSRPASRPNSPMVGENASLRVPGSRKRVEGSSFDMEGEGADDEQAPLIGTVHRTPRAKIPRRIISGPYKQPHYYSEHRRGWASRCAGCIVASIMSLLVILGAAGFLLATTKSLYEVEVLEIKNVLASEQEIMLDLLVSAVNPNIIPVSIADMDVNIFAKSKHVGTDAYWRRHGHPPPASATGRRRGSRGHSKKADDVHALPAAPYQPLDDDPRDRLPSDPEKDSQTMLLGRIFTFDTALLFEGSPLQRLPHPSVGEVRLARPGNKTEAGGTERWERVIQYPFELIIRGILKYQLPLSNRVRTSSIGASAIVHPEEGLDLNGGMRIEICATKVVATDDGELVSCV